MNAATALAGAELRISRSQLIELPEGTFYRHDLVGCVAEQPDGTAIGTVTAVEGSVERSRLVVDTGASEVLIPLVPEICTLVDPATKRIVVAPPDGLLELNAGESRRAKVKSQK
jgi:16S rRNA processing protein RimM